MPSIDHDPSFAAAVCHWGSVALVAFTILAGAGPVPAAAFEPAVLPAVHDGPSASMQAWRAAMQAGDLAALARMHDASTISYPPDKLQSAGTAAILKDYAALFASYTVRVTFDDAHWTVEGPLLVSWGRTTLSLHPKAGGRDMDTHARFTDAAVKIDGGWRYLVDHASKPN